jgi:O-antigen ligase
VFGRAYLLLFAVVLVCCLLLGGGTRAGFLSDAIAQLTTIPLLLAALWRLWDWSLLKRLRWPLAFCLAIVLVPLLQLVPLPPEVWTALPNREQVAGAFELLQRDLPWMPISVSPNATALSALSLLPPVAIFLAMLTLDRRGRRLISLAVLAVGVLNVTVGLNQLVQGPESPLRFFAYTNPTEAVGFFANRNHYAAFLYSATLIAAAWAVEAVNAFEVSRRRFEGRAVVALAATFTILVALVAAQAMARSRAGLGLTILALAGAFVLAFSDRRHASGFTPARLIVGASSLAIMFAAQFALYRIMERFSSDPLEDARITFARNTIEAAKAYMPFGSGMGTFVPVYAGFEKPEEAMIDTYANRAHNDVLEVWLEAGAAGLMLMALFTAWLAIAAWQVWRREVAGAAGIDLLLARSATLIVALVAAHSFVDYPLRTTGMMAFMAFACGLLVPMPATAAEEVGMPVRARSRARRQPVEQPAAPRPQPARSPVPASPSAPVAAPASSPAAGGGDLWGQGIEWPEEWRGTEKPGPAARPPRPKDKP